MSRRRPPAAGSVFGGAGGKGTRVSIASLEGLRSVLLRNEPAERDPASSSSANPAASSYANNNNPVDDKKTMRGLNERLSGYLGRVRQLEEANGELQGQIDQVLAERGAPGGRDWDAIERPLADLRKTVKDMTMGNAKLMLQIDNSKLANDDFQNKLEAETQACHSVESDLIGLKRIIDDTQLNRLQLESQDVEDLRQKIRDSAVVVEVDSQDSDLAETLNKIRTQYDKLARNNQKETDTWYQSKFENIKVEGAQNTEALQSGRTEIRPEQPDPETPVTPGNQAPRQSGPSPGHR
ncbi:hypothetical protein NHX12_015047 [Muraenolepis orangiensis]|uniref:IF rod domain-containing protein n=1 Tax=Muraenolepis orangiensis TaxID=630683 RepID=A0A9Q0DDA3_9TELE|nr:hypothetical protein NHX12_015047 [Muraenolepis orangiensis]